MIGSASASAFSISGGSASSGSLSSTRETRSRTSFAAASMSRSRSNSMVMLERSSLLLRAHLVDALDAGDLVLDDLRDLRLDHRGGRAAVDGLDR